MRTPIVAAVGCSLLLALAAFWPSGARDVPKRPSLRGPIVLDELVRTASDPAPAGDRASP